MCMFHIHSLRPSLILRVSCGQNKSTGSKIPTLYEQSCREVGELYGSFEDCRTGALELPNKHLRTGVILIHALNKQQEQEMCGEICPEPLGTKVKEPFKASQVVPQKPKPPQMPTCSPSQCHLLHCAPQQQPWVPQGSSHRGKLGLLQPVVRLLKVAPKILTQASKLRMSGFLVTSWKKGKTAISTQHLRWSLCHHLQLQE